MKIDEFVKDNSHLGVEKYEPIDKVIAVYFICEADGEIAYIGKTSDIVHRMDHHEKMFDGCLVYFFRITQEEGGLREDELIELARPKLNKRIAGKFTRFHPAT